jgi:hypothetical protein
MASTYILKAKTYKYSYGGLQFATVDTRCSVLPFSHALRHGRFTTLIWIFFGELPLLGGMGGIRRERRE